MTTPKNAPKKGPTPRRARVTAAEIRRREQTQVARESIGHLGDPELANYVERLAIKQADIFDYELLIAVAHRLNEPTAVTPKFARGGVITGATLFVNDLPADGIIPKVFHSPTADSVEEPSGGFGPSGPPHGWSPRKAGHKATEYTSTDRGES